MAYQVLARKCRPQDFSGLIGQEPIVTALRNAITDGRIAQAYVFAGIRGVGKTSAARILAKALNCEKGPTPDPCNQCQACTEITRGGSMDVIEVDAATYSKVEQVRELTESLKYGPANGRYKVVILDEVHRLSRQAFDALLKIIEEPPAHLVFIFATTEMEAVPATILSRCQELIFRRVPVAVLARHLATLCEAENLQVSETTLRLIARAGEGSVRDSVALLDQLATFGGGGIADEDAARLLGGLDTALFEALLGAILDGDPATVTATVARLEEEGRDPRQAFAQFLTYCREALHLSLGASADAIDLPGEEAEKLGQLARGAGYENLLRLVQSLLGSEPMVRRSEVGSLALEIAWLKTAELPKLVRVEEILKAGLPAAGAGGEPRKPASQGPRVQRQPPSPTPRKQKVPPDSEPPQRKSKLQPPPPAPESKSIPEPEPPPEFTPPAAPSPVPEPASELPSKTGPAGTPPTRGNPRTVFLEEVSQRKVPLGAHLSRCRLEIQGTEVTIRVPENDTTLLKALERKNNRDILTQAAAQALGSGATWTSATEKAPEESKTPVAPQGETRENGSTDEEAAHPTQQLLTDLFDGAVETDA